MGKEKEKFELNDDQLEKVSGGTGFEEEDDGQIFFRDNIETTPNKGTPANTQGFGGFEQNNNNDNQ